MLYNTVLIVEILKDEIVVVRSSLDLYTICLIARPRSRWFLLFILPFSLSPSLAVNPFDLFDCAASIAMVSPLSSCLSLSVSLVFLSLYLHS